jgi:F0F1-type ATP synthase membrane subunit c/vacuolar-type H+-ATPase subunit K
MLGIALTGLAVGGAWLAVAIVVGVSIGRAVRIADARTAPAEPEIEIEADGGPLLGVVLPRQQHYSET